jgi:O-acetyl-ADP-ribose deacetylase (regulator of RNase III)
MGALCGKPAQEEQITTRASVSFKLAYNNVTFENINGDISDQVVDAIVNAANNQLAHNSGLASTLVIKGGQIIQEESNRFIDEADNGILDVGTAVVTSAGNGNIQARFIIHVVSPTWVGGENGEEEKLAIAIINALSKADENNIASIAVPCLTGGSFGFPIERSAHIMVKSCIEYLDVNTDSGINSIRFVNMDAQTVRVFKNELERVLRKNNPIDEVEQVELRETVEIIEQDPNGNVVVEEVQVVEVVEVIEVVQDGQVEEVLVEEVREVVVEEVVREFVEEEVVREIVEEEVVREIVEEEVVREVVEEEVVQEIVQEEVVEEVLEVVDQDGQVEEVAVVEVVEVREVVEEREFIVEDQDGNVEEEVVLERSPVDLVIETTEDVLEETY